MRKTSQTWSSKALNSTLTMKCTPASTVKPLTMSGGDCLWSHQVDKQRCTTKLQVPQKAIQAWPTAEEKTIVQKQRIVWHRTWQHSWHQGAKRLNEMQERFPLRPAYGQPLQWDGSTKVEGGWHHTEVVETKHPGYPLGLHFDNILNLLLILVYWLFSPENSLDF